MNPDLPGEDKIYNGALDNSLGVASIIAAGEAFAAANPRRSVLFLSVMALAPRVAAWMESPKHTAAQRETVRHGPNRAGQGALAERGA